VSPSRSRERLAVAGAFLIHSTVSGTWAPRLPAIKSSLDLSDGELGTALVGLAIGLLAGTRLAGAPVDRFGSRPVMRVGFPVLCATLLLPALADSLATLFLALLALGLMAGLLDVAMNAQGIEVERHLGRPLLNGLHGLWSVGLGLGAGGAALAAAAGLDPLEHFAIVAALLAGVSVVLLRWLLPTPHHRIREAAEVGRVPWTLALVLLGVIAFCSFAGEGAASDWSAVYLAQELSASGGLAAVGFAAFATAMAVSRFTADRLRARFGPVALVRGGALVAAAGLLLGLVVHEPAAVIAAFAVLGCGLGPIVPTVFGAAGELDPRATGRLVGRVATLGYVGTVVGPIVIGWVAQATSLRAALGLVVALALLIAAIAWAASPGAGRAPRRSARARRAVRP
jgi:MFS family permease